MVCHRNIYVCKIKRQHNEPQNLVFVTIWTNTLAILDPTCPKLWLLWVPLAPNSGYFEPHILQYDTICLKYPGYYRPYMPKYPGYYGNAWPGTVCLSRTARIRSFWSSRRCPLTAEWLHIACGSRPSRPETHKKHNFVNNISCQFLNT